MKRLLVFLVLVGLAVPGLGDTTKVSVDVVLISDSLLIFDSIVVVGPCRDKSVFWGWPPEKRMWFVVTVDFYAKKPIRFSWFGNPFPISWDYGGREIIGRGETVFRYKLLADTVIVRRED